MGNGTRRGSLLFPLLVSKRFYGFRSLIFLLIIVGLILSSCSQQMAVKMGFLTYNLKSVPVSVSYKIERVGVIEDSKHTAYILSLNFKNIGSEKVNFLIQDLVAIDDAGNVYKPIFDYRTSYSWYPGVSLYPKQNTTLNHIFKSLPQEGTIYFEVYGFTESYEYVKLETVNLPFKV